MFMYTDQLGNVIILKERPKKIISIVPSQSELLWDLGLKEELIGITKFCIHPGEMYKSVERVGGTKDLDLEKIRNLKPDIIIGNKEENEISQIKMLQKDFNVWMSDVYDFDDAFEMINGMGEIFGRVEEASDLLARIKGLVKNIKNIFAKQRVAYFIWNKPYMCAANNTFINYVLNYIGFENALSHLKRYPELPVEVLKKVNPELCLLSSEPFPFKEQHVMELQKKLPGSKIMIVDGEMFSWYGSRLLRLEKYVNTLPMSHADH